MIRSHCQLLDVSAESQTLQDLHFGSTQLSESVEVYVDAALSVAATTNYEQVQQNELSLFEQDDVEGLLQNLNAAVTIYEAQSKARVTNLETRNWFVDAHAVHFVSRVALNLPADGAFHPLDIV